MSQRGEPQEIAGEGEPLSEEEPPGAHAKVAAKSHAKRPAPSVYTLRLEYAPEVAGDLPIKEEDILANWSREFTVSGKNTLEQLSETILSILGWDRDHLYEFRIADRVYVQMVSPGEDDLFVDSMSPCVSCDIPIRLVGLSVADIFAYIFDFGDYRTFRITVLGIQAAPDTPSVPALLSYRGKNIIQYRGTMRKHEAREFEARPPTVEPPDPPRAHWRIRFIRGPDRKLLEEWRASNDKKLWQKAATILDNRNLSPEAIASKIERPVYHVQNWIRAFNRYGIDGLDRPRKPRARGDREAKRDRNGRRVLEILHAKPSAYGINRSNWSLPAIARAFEQEHKEVIGTTTVGGLLRKFGYAIRKARRVLTSPDPDYREKVDLLLNTLQSLKPNELFFFVDELGPLRVKKYGGRALVRKNEALTYPQEQERRGTIMMSGALSATTNQVSWIYGRAKDTSAMIDLTELLYNQHFSATKLYVTWDVASWHRSATLLEWLDAFNAATRSTGEGPIIELVPLPTSSQFLDVIEAVFSGMKRAVVHHSDYRDVTEMKTAISLHFAERNAHFRDNPRRAGKKIWEVDFFDDNENIRSGNYREW
jgi:transposase